MPSELPVAVTVDSALSFETTPRRPESVHRAVYLTGMMGSGKSTVARLLAAHLGVRMLDLDACVEARCGESIAVLLPRLQAERGATAGEAHFRQLERETLLAVQEQIAQESQPNAGPKAVVVACGGGIVLDSRNVAAMRERGRIVYLEVSAAVLVQRLSVPEQRAARPLLQASDLAERVKTLLAARQDAYLACDLRVDANRSPQEVANAIAAWLNPTSHVGAST